MNRYFLNATPCCDNQSADMDLADDGGFYRVEDVEPIVTDREVKASNLEKLVDMVLAFDVALDKIDASDHIVAADHEALQTIGEAMIDLARGLKQ